jgi:hypothetical protein
MLRSDWIDDPRICHGRFADLIRASICNGGRRKGA